ncbi:hypothetical protein [Microbispora hainanensis]|uniref:Uncharacterized protein n=1 Tax=Microbispora hainanensis TaxID=568844 RepID=A0A544YUC9_9ACTN|nr:hypothetical protein [Microbispora hainanensis]TQS20386.1 hypothetical protein FLX08_16060 [Microbispora hainanensis]
MGPGMGPVTPPAVGVATGHPAPVAPLQVHCAVTLQRLYGWLQASLPQAPQVAGIIPLLVQAVQLYRAGRYDACLAQIQFALGAVAPGRLTVPLL